MPGSPPSGASTKAQSQDTTTTTTTDPTNPSTPRRQRSQSPVQALRSPVTTPSRTTPSSTLAGSSTSIYAQQSSTNPLSTPQRQPYNQRAGSPTFNRRSTSSPVTAGRDSLPATPQRPSSRTGVASSIHAPTTPATSPPPNAQAALSSLQELIRTMPAPLATGGGPPPLNINDSPSNPNPNRVNSPGPSSSTTIPRASPTISTSQPPTLSSSTSTRSGSTLNPNAGGFQPGALSALGEVDHEVLITPIATSFDGTLASPSSHSHSSSQNNPVAGNNPFNVFGSPIQTPQHQIGNHHHQPFVAPPNPAEWQNYHNVFNAGIGNAGAPATSATPQSGMPGLEGMSNDMLNNPAALAALSMNPMAQQLAMLQLQQAQLAASQSNFPGSPAQAQAQALALQQQQIQMQALLQAQMAAVNQQQHQQAQHQPNQASNLPPRFAQSQSQQDLASNTFMAEQLALQAQYEQLRQQQQELLTRFQEMQFQAAQLAQAQVAASGSNHGSPSQNANLSSPPPPQPQHVSNTNGTGSAGRQGSHRRAPSHSMSGAASSGPMGQFGSMGQFSLPSGSTNAPTYSSSGNLPKGHGRRHSVNVTRKTDNINSAFSFPTGSNNPTQNAGAGGFAQTHHHAGSGASDANDFTRSMSNLNLQGTATGEEDTSTSSAPHTSLPPTAAGRLYGHGRRESRGSIGSLAGWGSNSNIVTQSSVPITNANVTDLAQAQAQLQQLSQFRASAGHSRVPSFGVQQFQPSSGPNASQNQQQRKSLFAPYLPAASIPPLLQTGKLVIGTLRVNKRNRSDAYVSTDVLEADVFICGSKDRNRALEGDVVAVELLDVDEVWGTKKEKEEKKRRKEELTSYDPKFSQQLRKQDKKKDDVEVEGQGLTLFEDEEVNDDSKPMYAGHVVAVVERQAGQLFAGTLGILRPSSAATKEKQDAERRERDGVDVRGQDDRQSRPKIIWFKPIDKRVPLVAIPADQAPENFLDAPDQYNSTLFVACIKRWPVTSLHPFGSLVEELGEIGNIEAETNALLKDNGFTDEIFTESVTKCLPPVPWTIPQTEIEARKDFRQCRVFTIDPETAKDLDDALHINKLDDETYEVGVHIADVSHFVKPNTALDREARRRATTVYLVQRASPMLPPALSESLCSLQPNEDRLTFSAVFKLSQEGRVLSTWFGKSVIKSAAKLAYSNAQSAIEKDTLPEDVQIYGDHDAEGIINDIKQLDALARQMRERRFENGALRIDNVKLSFTLDSEGRPEDCKVYERQEAHSLIEEFMLLANQAVASKIASALPEQALLRRHEEPILRRLEGFAKRAGRLGFDMDIDTAGNLMQSFQKLDRKDPALILRLLATKAMVNATYICSGMFDIAKYHHYALNIPIYTHFTSPIRRYADVTVHRQLEAALTENPETRFLMDAEAVSKVAQHCNNKKASAKMAQEQSQHLYLCTLISDLTQKYGPVRRQASVIGVLDQAFDVVVPDFGIEKRVHVDQMPIENHVHDERSNTLQLYWKKGVDVIKFLAENSGDPHLQRIKQTAEQHAKLMEASSQSVQAESALFEDDEEEEAHPKEADGPITSAQRAKSANKAAPVFEGVEETAAGHCVQTIKELQNIPVIISADLTVCPPVIKVFAVNPSA